MNLKYFISILVLLVISTVSFSQKKRKAVKEIKTDTVFVFAQLEEESFSEKNVYWPEKGEMTLIYRQMYNNPSTWDEEHLPSYFGILSLGHHTN